jgi:hypothetical protein
MPAKIKSHARKNVHRRSHKPRGISDHAFKKVYWPYLPVVLIISVLLSLSVQSGALMALVRNPDGKVLAYATSMSVSGLLSSTNVARAQNGVAALSLNNQLDAAAQAKANDMASRNYWSHNTPEGNPPWVFVTNQGYSYQKLGENLATGFNDEQSTINGWMNSPPHKENLLDTAFTEVGFGYANNPNYTSAGGGPMTIVVAFYGKPQVLSQQTSAPPVASTSPPASSAPPKSTPAPAPQPEAQLPASAATPTAQTPQPSSKTPPATTQNSALSSDLAAKSSRAQLVLGSGSLAKFGTSLAILAALAAIGVWLSRHAFAVRRALAYSETFAIRHPLMDIGLLVIAALSFLLTQTAGLIQ